MKNINFDYDYIIYIYIKVILVNLEEILIISYLISFFKYFRKLGIVPRLSSFSLKRHLRTSNRVKRDNHSLELLVKHPILPVNDELLFICCEFNK